MHKRQIEITVGDGFEDVVAETRTKVWEAIGYLSSWAWDSPLQYAGPVRINCDREGNIQARYSSEDGNLTYFIFASRDAADGSYSYHS